MKKIVKSILIIVLLFSKQLPAQGIISIGKSEVLSKISKNNLSLKISK